MQDIATVMLGALLIVTLTGIGVGSTFLKTPTHEKGMPKAPPTPQKIFKEPAKKDPAPLNHPPSPLKVSKVPAKKDPAPLNHPPSPLKVSKVPANKDPAPLYHPPSPLKVSKVPTKKDPVSPQEIPNIKPTKKDPAPIPNIKPVQKDHTSLKSPSLPSSTLTKSTKNLIPPSPAGLKTKTSPQVQSANPAPQVLSVLKPDLIENALPIQDNGCGDNCGFIALIVMFMGNLEVANMILSKINAYLTKNTSSPVKAPLEYLKTLITNRFQNTKVPHTRGTELVKNFFAPFHKYNTALFPYYKGVPPPDNVDACPMIYTQTLAKLLFLKSFFELLNIAATFITPSISDPNKLLYRNLSSLDVNIDRYIIPNGDVPKKSEITVLFFQQDQYTKIPDIKFKTIYLTSKITQGKLGHVISGHIFDGKLYLYNGWLETNKEAPCRSFETSLKVLEEKTYVVDNNTDTKTNCIHEDDKPLTDNMYAFTLKDKQSCEFIALAI